MERVKVSIIIPVYNMAEFLKSAIESIEKQTLQEKEIICIDDGSTDSSYDVAIEYAAIYPNISVYRQKNQGPGIARNLGIKKAKGEFVCFLDADDFYADTDVLEYLYDLAKTKSMKVCGGSSCNYQNGKISIMGVRPERKFTENRYITKEEYPGVVGYCAFIYERNFLIRNEIFFPGYLMGEDPVFFTKAIGCSKGAYCTTKLIYVYRKGHKKVKFAFSRTLDLAKSWRDMFIIASTYNMRRIYNVLFNDLKGEIGAMIYRFSMQGSEEMKKIIKEINACIDENLLDEGKLENGKILLEGKEINEYVYENEKIKEEFIDRLKNTNRVFVFGAGVIGKAVALFLKENNVNIRAFVVSDSIQNASKVEGIPVRTIETIGEEANDYIVIIATFWYAQEEIISMLRAEGIQNIYPVDLRRFCLWQEKIEY